MLGPRLEVKARSVKRNRMGVTLGWSHATSCTHIHTHTLNYTYTNTHTHRRVYYVLMLQRMIYNLRIGRHSYRCWFLRGLMFSQFAIGPTSLLRETRNSSIVDTSYNTPVNSQPCKCASCYDAVFSAPLRYRDILRSYNSVCLKYGGQIIR